MPFWKRNAKKIIQKIDVGDRFFTEIMAEKYRSSEEYDKDITKAKCWRKVYIMTWKREGSIVAIVSPISYKEKDLTKWQSIFKRWRSIN